MSNEMMQANPVDVLRALENLEKSIKVWKDAVYEVYYSEAETMSIAQGPFDPVQVEGPVPPFIGCGPASHTGPNPAITCLYFDINVYAEQVLGVLLGLYFGLEHDQGHVSNP